MDSAAHPAGLADAFDMNKDGICLWAVSDAPIPIEGAQPAAIAAPYISYDETRDISPVTVSCSVPAWLKNEADSQGIDYSALLQRAILDYISNNTEEKNN